LLRGLESLRSLNGLYNWLLNYLRYINLLLYLRSLYLVFDFVIFYSFYLSGLSDIFGFVLGYVFSSLYWNIFNSLDRNLFFNGVKDDPGYIFLLVFNSLVFGFYYFSGNSFDVFSFNFFVFNYVLINVFGDFFFYIFVFDFSSFDRIIFNSAFSLDALSYLRLLRLYQNLRRYEGGLGLAYNSNGGRSLIVYDFLGFLLLLLRLADGEFFDVRHNCR